VRTGKIALILYKESNHYELIESLGSEDEISVFEKALRSGVENPLSEVYRFRSAVEIEDEKNSDYIEELISQPFEKLRVKEKGVRWFQSKIRLNKHKRSEAEANHIIAEFAYRLFKKDPSKKDFILVGPSAEVKVKVFMLDLKLDCRRKSIAS